jgi:hypothetical protein
VPVKDKQEQDHEQTFCFIAIGATHWMFQDWPGLYPTSGRYTQAMALCGKQYPPKCHPFEVVGTGWAIQS